MPACAVASAVGSPAVAVAAVDFAVAASALVTGPEVVAVVGFDSGSAGEESDVGLVVLGVCLAEVAVWVQQVVAEAGWGEGMAQ